MLWLVCFAGCCLTCAPATKEAMQQQVAVLHPPTPWQGV
jgi:hypothetical protein